MASDPVPSSDVGNRTSRVEKRVIVGSTGSSSAIAITFAVPVAAAIRLLPRSREMVDLEQGARQLSVTTGASSLSCAAGCVARYSRTAARAVEARCRGGVAGVQVGRDAVDCCGGAMDALGDGGGAPVGLVETDYLVADGRVEGLTTRVCTAGGRILEGCEWATWRFGRELGWRGECMSRAKARSGMSKNRALWKTDNDSMDRSLGPRARSRRR